MYGSRRSQERAKKTELMARMPAMNRASRVNPQEPTRVPHVSDLVSCEQDPGVCVDMSDPKWQNFGLSVSIGIGGDNLGPFRQHNGI